MNTGVKAAVTAVTVAVLAFGACQTGGPAAEGTANGTAAEDRAVVSADFARDVQGRDWILARIVTGTQTVTLDRERLAREEFGEIFTLRFDDNLVAGTGAPNTYRAPYTPGDDRSLAIGLLATTMMFAFREPEEINEQRFFLYLNNVGRWDMTDGTLELHTTGEDGTEVVLVFVPVSPEPADPLPAYSTCPTRSIWAFRSGFEILS
uniref:DUF306 domain-containing protein n=1 Tax=uncultured bacterium contig00088 TaxID=1181561 RepID=A0A806KS38_9BACT|nr:hypothetical protein [uncultured bacterium contig00088]